MSPRLTGQTAVPGQRRGRWLQGFGEEKPDLSGYSCGDESIVQAGVSSCNEAFRSSEILEVPFPWDRHSLQAALVFLVT